MTLFGYRLNNNNNFKLSTTACVGEKNMWGKPFMQIKKEPITINQLLTSRFFINSIIVYNSNIKPNTHNTTHFLMHLFKVICYLTLAKNLGQRNFWLAASSPATSTSLFRFLDPSSTLMMCFCCSVTTKDLQKNVNLVHAH